MTNNYNLRFKTMTLERIGEKDGVIQEAGIVPSFTIPSVPETTNLQPVAALTLSGEQELFITSALDKNHVDGILLLGKAGVGKSTVTRELFRRADELGLSYLRCAPTGVAAINIGGETVHRIINLARRNHKVNVDFIVVDETSMMRADLLDELDTVLRHAMLCDKPFGGIKIILVGDPGQLPPVIKEDADKKYMAANYYCGHFFASFAFSQAKWRVIELTKIFRQKDERFPRILNLMREGKDIEKVCAYFNKYRVVTEPRGVVLCPTNAAAAQINDVQMRKLDRTGVRFVAKIVGEIDRKDFPIEAQFDLKIGAKVMIVKNIYRPTGQRDENGRPEYYLDLINGDVGMVEDLSENHMDFRCDRTGLTHLVLVEDGCWSKEKSVFDPATKRVHREVIGSFTQLPVRIAWAITIHKSQGATIEEMTIDLRTKLFDCGQAYVAFSRCTSLEKLWILGKLRPSDIMVSPQVTDFLANKLQSQFVGKKAGSIFDVPELDMDGAAEKKAAAESDGYKEMFGE